MKPKTTVIVSFLTALNIATYGQKSSDVVAKEICKCIEIKISRVDNKHLSDSVKSCFGRGMALDMPGLFKEYGMSEDYTVGNIQGVGSRLRKKLEQDCEAYKNYLKRSDK
jgi:hypothetical protein